MLKKRSWHGKPRLNPDLLASLVIIGVGIFFFSDFLFSSKNFYFRDILNFHYPLRKILIESYSRGEFPLWNPFIYLGQPMLANPNYMAFYPTNLLHLFLPFNYAFKLHFILHPIMAGLGAYFLQRRLGICNVAALTGSLAYEFSGTVLSFLNLYNIIPAVALLPWIGYAFIGALREHWLRRSLLLGALLAIQIIALEPLMLQCLILTLAAFAIYHLMETRDHMKAARNVLRVGAFSVFFGLGLAAIQVLPTLELLPLSARGEFDFVEVSRWSMHPLDFLSAAVPNMFGSYYTINLAGAWGDSIHEGREGYLVSFFLGSCLLLLTLLSFSSRRKKMWRVLAGLALVSVILTLGRYNPLYKWLFDHVPFFALGRYPSKYFLLSTLAFCMMASLGLEAFLQQSETPKERGHRLVCAICGILIAGVFLIGWGYLHAHPAILEKWLRYEMGPEKSLTKNFSDLTTQLNASILASGIYFFAGGLLFLTASFSRRRILLGGLLPVLILAELIPANLRLSPSISDADVDFVPEINTYIQQNGPEEGYRVVTPTLLRPMPDLHLRTPNRSSAWLVLFYKMSGQPFFGMMNGIQYSLDRSVDHLNTREAEALYSLCGQMPDASALTLLQKMNSPLILSMEELTDPRLRLISTFDNRSELPSRAYWLENTLGRAYFVSGTDVVPSEREALDRYLQPEFRVGNTVILEGEGKSEMGETGAGSIKILNYKNSRVECEVRAKTDGYLVLLDSFYPGWSAYVDGRETPVLKANYAFRAVRVPEGIHRVEFIYRPASFYLGLALSSIVLLGGLTILIIFGRKT
jgi:hypothetical protein